MENFEILRKIIRESLEESFDANFTTIDPVEEKKIQLDNVRMLDKQSGSSLENTQEQPGIGKIDEAKKKEYINLLKEEKKNLLEQLHIKDSENIANKDTK